MKRPRGPAIYAIILVFFGFTLAFVLNMEKKQGANKIGTSVVPIEIFAYFPVPDSRKSITLPDDLSHEIASIIEGKEYLVAKMSATSGEYYFFYKNKKYIVIRGSFNLYLDDGNVKIWPREGSYLQELWRNAGYDLISSDSKLEELVSKFRNHKF